MSEPTFICSAPELANQAQKIALYSHYAAAVAGFAGCAVMAMRARVQEKVPHILGAVAAGGIGLAALFSQWEFNQYLYMHREHAGNALGTHVGLWAIWGVLILVGLSLLPGFRFKRMGKLALIPLIGFTFLGFVAASFGDALAGAVMTAMPTVEGGVATAAELEMWQSVQKAAAFGSALLFGLPALFCAIGAIVAYVISQAKKVEKRSMENHQSRTGVMTMVAVGIPAVVYSLGALLIASGPQGVDKAVLLFNCADVAAIFFLISATMSLLGVPANFPKPVKPPKPKKEKAKDAVLPTPEADPTMLDQQQAYAQAYAQQLYAQQQAYAAYQQQQQAYAAQQQAQQPQAVPAAAPAQVPEAPVAQQAPAGMPAQPSAADLRQQQAQYYAQQQAYAAYQQQQQAYQQAYAAQQQQAYAQAYAQQQLGIQQQHNQVAPSGGIRPARVGTPRQVAPAAGVVKKVGGPRQIKKIR